LIDFFCTLLPLDVEHNWLKMVENVQNKIRSLNFNYRVSLKTKKVTYINAYGTFEDKHRVKVLLLYSYK